MSDINRKPVIVVAGYGSWPTAKNNPCAEVVEILKSKTFADCDLRCYEMPVISSELTKNIETIVEEVEPDAWIGLGVAIRYTSIHVEDLGFNRINLPVPDAAGNISRTKYIFQNAPLAYEATLPNEYIVSSLKNRGIPAITASNAGTHLCNQMLYTTCHLAAVKQRMLAGFLHLPQTIENVIKDLDRLEPGPSMPLDMLVEAVGIAIECVTEDLEATSK